MNQKTKNTWFKEIPSEWKLCKTKYLIKFINGYAFESDDMSLEGTYPVIRIGDIKNNGISYESCLYVKDNNGLEKYQIKKDDILIAMSGATVGKIGIATETKNSYINQRVGIIRCDNPKYMFYLLSTNEFMEYVYLNSPGSAQPNISDTQVGMFEIPLPSIEEQNLIVNFLDEKCNSVDLTIEKTEKEILILEEYKYSLITETVKKKLNDDSFSTKMNTEWIGEIPSEWNAKRLKYVATLKGRIGWQGLTADEYQDEGPYLITGVDFKDGKIDWDSCVHISEKRWQEATDIQIENGDLLITKDGTVGKVAIVEDLTAKASLNSGVMVIKLSKEYSKRYLYWVLKSDVFWKWFDLNNAGNSTIIHLYQNEFANFTFPIPSFEEQVKISNYLDEKVATIENTINKLKTSLELLKQYKKSLIYEYVSGNKRLEVK